MARWQQCLEEVVRREGCFRGCDVTVSDCWRVFARVGYDVDSTNAGEREEKGTTETTRNCEACEMGQSRRCFFGGVDD